MPRGRSQATQAVGRPSSSQSGDGRSSAGLANPPLRPANAALRFLTLIGLCLSLGGCATYTAQTAALRSNWSSGNIAAAATAASGLAEKSGPPHDRLLLRLEQANILRAAGDFQASAAIFEEANATFEDDDLGPDLRISSAGAGLITNPAQTPYTGRTYDRIFATAYNALNYIALGDPAAARVALNQAYFWEQRSVETHAAKIEDRLATLQSGDQPGADEALDQSDVRTALDDRLSALAEYAVYAPYVNPFSVWIDGLFFLHLGSDAADLERARKSFERLLPMAPENPFVRADLERAENGSGPAAPPSIYVLFETGIAPTRRADVVNLPLWIFDGDVPYFGIALPALVFDQDYRRGLEIVGDGIRVQTRLLANVDAIIATEFRDTYPVIFMRALLAGIVKAAAQYGVQEAFSNQDQAVQSLVLIAGLLYQYSMNQADLRTWTTLPKQIQIARLPRPASGVIEIHDPHGPTRSLELEPGRHILVSILAQSRVAPLNIHQLTLVP